MIAKPPPATVPIYCSHCSDRRPYSWQPGRKPLQRGQVLAVRDGDHYYCECCGRVVSVAW